MKPADLYKLTPINVSHDPYHIKNQVGEIDFYRLKSDDIPELSIRYYAQTCHDGERVWYLYSVWIRDTPIMVCQEAGRGGSDYQNQFVTNWAAYKELVAVLLSHYETPEEDAKLVYDPDEEITELVEFYGDSLDRHYDANLKPKYAVGDVVAVNVLVNHLRYNSEKVTTRVRIERIYQFNPTKTYYGLQLDRRWKEGEWEVITDVGKGSLGASFSDADVVGLADK